MTAKVEDFRFTRTNMLANVQLVQIGKTRENYPRTAMATTRLPRCEIAFSSHGDCVRSFDRGD